MLFFTFLTKNLRRRPLRSLLTITAVALGVGTVISLVGIATGFKASFLELYDEVGIDLLVIKGGSGRSLQTPISEEYCDKIRAVPGVVDVIPGLIDTRNFEEYNLYQVVINGMVPESIAFDHLKLAEGRFLRKDDHRKIVIGKILASNIEKNVGDKIEVYDNEFFEVVGIFDSFNVFEAGSLMIPLKELQTLLEREGEVTGISIIAKPGSSEEELKAIREQVHQLDDGLTARSAKEHVDQLTEIRLATAMSWLTSAIALLIGGVGVMNTMIMTVQERTKEIGVLRAIGWKPSRVIKMILMESILQSIVGIILGVIGAICIVRALTNVPSVNGLMDGRIQPIVILYGVALGLGLGIVGGLVPAAIASRMTPTEALRKE